MKATPSFAFVIFLCSAALGMLVACSEDNSNHGDSTDTRQGDAEGNGFGDTGAGDTDSGDTAAGDTDSGDTAAGDTDSGDSDAQDSMEDANTEPPEDTVEDTSDTGDDAPDSTGQDVDGDDAQDEGTTRITCAMLDCDTLYRTCHEARETRDAYCGGCLGGVPALLEDGTCDRPRTVNPVGDLRASQGEYWNQIELRWIPSTTDHASYHIYRDGEFIRRNWTNRDPESGEEVFTDNNPSLGRAPEEPVSVTVPNNHPAGAIFLWDEIPDAPPGPVVDYTVVATNGFDESYERHATGFTAPRPFTELKIMRPGDISPVYLVAESVGTQWIDTEANEFIPVFDPELDVELDDVGCPSVRLRIDEEASADTLGYTIVARYMTAETPPITVFAGKQPTAPLQYTLAAAPVDNVSDIHILSEDGPDFGTFCLDEASGPWQLGVVVYNPAGSGSVWSSNPWTLD